MKIILFFLLVFFEPVSSQADSFLNPFFTDWCTLYPEGTARKPNAWKHCCLEHDLYFWAGGSFHDRLEADSRLRECVKKSGHPYHAYFIYRVVSVGRKFPIRLNSMRWGNAWDKRPRYLSLSEKETAEVLYYIDNEVDISEELKQSFMEQLNSRMDLE